MTILLKMLVLVEERRGLESGSTELLITSSAIAVDNTSKVDDVFLFKYSRILLFII
jgi:hypothetical protein